MDSDFEVLQENWEIVQLFLQVQTQWRTGPGGAIGLDYPAVEMVCRVRRRPLTPAVLDGLQLMEMAVLSELGKTSS